MLLWGIGDGASGLTVMDPDAIIKPEKLKKIKLFHFLKMVLQPCEHTQLDFMAEQCSQTDPHPLYLQPNIASFYTWIPAVGFATGVPGENPSFCAYAEKKHCL